MWCVHVACVARPLKQQFRWCKPPVQAQNRLVSSQGFGRCWSSEPGSLSLPWRGSSFQINTVHKADRFLKWTLVWVPIYYKKPVKKMVWELRAWFQNITCAQNTSAGVNHRMVETSWVSWVSNLWKYHIMSFFFFLRYFVEAAQATSAAFSSLPKGHLVPFFFGFSFWTTTRIGNPARTCHPVTTCT